MMNSELQNLYQEVIMDHNNNPCNFYILKDATSSAEGYNPLCGDRVKIYIKLNADIIEEISFTGDGCAISKASASIMVSELTGKSVDDAISRFKILHRMLVSKEYVATEMEYESIGKAIAFLGVKNFPMRIKCASLAWHAMNEALLQKES